LCYPHQKFYGLTNISEAVTLGNGEQGYADTVGEAINTNLTTKLPLLSKFVENSQNNEILDTIMHLSNILFTFPQLNAPNPFCTTLTQSWILHQQPEPSRQTTHPQYINRHHRITTSHNARYRPIHPPPAFCHYNKPTWLHTHKSKCAHTWTIP
jgi:hypothetical protein